MGAEEVFVILCPLAALSVWVYAGYRAFQLGAFNGLSLFLIHLIVSCTFIFVMWGIVVYPTIDCVGHLCGLVQLLFWMVSSMIIMIIWPLIFIGRCKKKWPEKPKALEKSDDLLDDFEDLPTNDKI